MGRHTNTAVLFEAGAQTFLILSMILLFTLIAIGSTYLVMIQFLEENWWVVDLIYVFFDLLPLAVAFAIGDREFKVDQYFGWIATIVLVIFIIIFWVNGIWWWSVWKVVVQCIALILIDAEITHITWRVREGFRAAARAGVP